MFDIGKFKEDFKLISFSTVHIFDDPEDQLFIWNKLIILYCIEEHTPLRKVKFTRNSSTLDERLDTAALQRDRYQLSFEAHLCKTEES